MTQKNKSLERMQNQFASLPDIDKDYIRLVGHLMTLQEQPNAKLTENRTGIKSIEDFGLFLRFDLRESFPLLQLKKTITTSVVAELIGFLRGYTNVKQFQELGTHIWDEWADPETGDLGPIYGAQWRRWLGPCGESIDQLGNAIDKIRNTPSCRRNIVTAWRPDEIETMALPPCHYGFQFHCDNDGHLDLLWNQRSIDVFLGLPFNIASYGILLSVVAKMTGRTARNLIISGGNFHLYENQFEGARTLMKRFDRVLADDPQYKIGKCPQIQLSDRVKDLEDIGDLLPEDISFTGYSPLPQIKVDVAI